MTNNLTFQHFKITRSDRERGLNQRGLLIWFTGLSGSGKSTIANALEIKLQSKGFHTYLLDGDNIRTGLNKNLSFSLEDRTENLRRIAEVSHLLLDAGLITLASFISPLESERQMIRTIVGAENYFEIFINTSLDECERRDVKGLYKKARKGEIEEFTGISSPYEIPQNLDLEINTEKTSVEEAVEIIFERIKDQINRHE